MTTDQSARGQADAGLQRLRSALKNVAYRAELEARHGAPAGMVAVYVGIEVDHALANHDGDAQDCLECIRRPQVQP